jgi:transcription elongation factor GreA-like protein/transcription elongation GreA/GreB family factor
LTDGFPQTKLLGMEVHFKIQFRHFLNKKDFASLEELWLDLIAQPDAKFNLNHLFELLQPLYNTFPDKAALFLSILAEHLKETGGDLSLLSVLKETTSFYVTTGFNNQEVRQLLKDIADCYRRLYSNRPNLENFLRKSSLLENQEVTTACLLLEQYLVLDVGCYVYSDELGLGKVVNFDLLLDRITVAFISGKTSYFSFSQDNKSLLGGLRPLSDDNFLVLKELNPGKLEAMAKVNPLALLQLLLKSVVKPIKAKDIKILFSGIISEDEWSRFWERVKKLAIKDPHIIITGSQDKTYCYSETKIQKAESPTEPQATSKSQVILGDKIPDLSKDEIIQLFDEFTNFTQLKKLLVLIKEKRNQDWFEIYSTIFRSTKDNRLFDIIAPELVNFDQKNFSAILTEIFRSYRFYPIQFLWLVAQASAVPVLEAHLGTASGSQFPAKSLLSRLLDLSSSPDFRAYWNECRKLITNGNYHLTKSAIPAMSEKEVQSFWQIVKKLSNLDELQKSEIKKIIKEFNPEFEKSEETDIVYSTAEGISKKQQELKELLVVAIPQSAKEIGRAREFGDLSENYEYKAAKEKQARLMTKANALRAELKRAKPINFNAVSADAVSIGTKVTVQDLSSGEIQDFTILGPYDIATEQRIISYLAPFAQMLIGKKIGATVTSHQSPLIRPADEGNGYKIIAITKVR